MPSAATTAKTDSKSTAEAHPESPIRQIVVLIEHKIRNLEKRKGKLDSYREVQKTGKQLTADQLVAVSKYDEVLQLLDFAREFIKQIHNISAVSEKEQKKIAKREVIQRTQQDIVKIREAIIIQNSLEQLADETVRSDFLNGTNGAVKIEKEEMEILEKFYLDAIPRRIENSEYGTFATTAHKSAEHMLYTIDGRTKVYYDDVTYEKVRSILQNIAASEYFEKKAVEEVPVESSNGENEVNSQSEEISAGGEKIVGDIDDNSKVQELEKLSGQSNDVDGVEKGVQNLELEAPVPASVPTPVFTGAMQSTPGNPTQTIPAQVAAVPIPAIVPSPVVPGAVLPVPPPNAVAVAATTPIAAVPPNAIPHIGPTTVRAVEQAYFKQHQYMQQMRPIAEVIGQGSFFFLQDSELDSPDPFPNVGVNFQNLAQQPQSNISNAGNTGNIQQVTSHPPPPQQQQSQQQQQQPLQNTPQSQPQQQQQQSISPQGAAAQTKSQIPSQTFTNQNFKTIVTQQPIYSQIKTTDLNPSHIPGFATNNQPINVGMAPTATIIPTVPQNVGNVQQNAVHIIAPAATAVPIPGFVSPQLVANPLGGGTPTNNQPPTVTQHHQQMPMQQQNSKIDLIGNVTVNSQIDSNSSNVKDQMPPIENWNANDALGVSQKSNGNNNSNTTGVNTIKDLKDDNKNDSKEWNDGGNHRMEHHSNDNHNTWTDSSNQQENNYLNNRGYHQRNVRGGSGGGGGNNGPPSARNTGGSANNYYRGGRANNTFQSNNSAGTGRPTNNTNNGSNTFFRNNDSNYYPTMQNGGNFNSGYNNNTNTYKSRGGGQMNTNSMRGQGGQQPQQSQQQQQQQQQHIRTNPQNGNQTIDRNMQQRSAPNSMNNRNNNNGPNHANVRPTRNNASSGGYRNNPGNSASSSRPSQTMNV